MVARLGSGLFHSSRELFTYSFLKKRPNVARLFHTSKAIYSSGIDPKTNNNCSSSSMTTPRVLSIQSHVVHGFVGNRCATFPLQLHGFEVDSINSVQFSNHTGYKHIKGEVLNSSQLGDLFEGLRLNDLTQYSHLLTGYCANDSFLLEIVKIIKDLRKNNPNLTYICDPVLGDNPQGGYYVQKSLMPIYRDVVIPLADIMTPNQFELQELSGVEVVDEASCIAAMRALHRDRGVPTIVVSSSELGGETTTTICGYASTTIRAKGSNPATLKFQLPKLPVDFVGTGDLFATLLLVWMQKTDSDLKASITHTLNSIQGILADTWTQAKSKAPENSKLSFADLELRLVQNQDLIMRPPTDNINIYEL